MKEIDAKRLETAINKAPNGVQATAEPSQHHHSAWLVRLTHQNCRHLCASDVEGVHEILAMWALLPDMQEVA